VSVAPRRCRRRISSTNCGLARASWFYLGLPLEDRRSIAAEAAEPRFVPETALVANYATGRSSTKLPWGRPNLRLLLDDEALDAYSLIPIARIQLVQGRAQLDRTFVPPVLRVRASPALEARLRAIEKGVLAAKVAVGEHRRTGPEMTGADAARLLVVTSLGRFLPLLQGVLAPDSVHPREAYRVVAELAGALSAFAPAGKVKIPPFDFLVSLRLLATNGARAGSLRAGDFAGTVPIGRAGVPFRSIAPSSPYVPPPMDTAFARRAVRFAAVPTGRDGLLASLKDALFLAVPSWAGAPEGNRGLHLRLAGLLSLEVSIARRTVAERATQHGYAYRLTVNESAFQGIGDLSLFGAVLGEALSRSAPVSTFVELTLVGAKTGFRTVYSPRSAS
jgi:hypothetical protein